MAARSLEQAVLVEAALSGVLTALAGLRIEMRRTGDDGARFRGLPRQD